MAIRTSNNGEFCDSSFFTLVANDLDNLFLRTTDYKKRFAIHRQLTRLRKKYCPKGSKNPKADRAAIDNFLNIQKEVSRPRCSFDPETLGEMKSFIFHVLEHGCYQLSKTPVAGTTFDPELILERWGTGPGSSNGAEFQHFVEKLGDNKLSYCNYADYLLPYLADVSPNVFSRFVCGAHEKLLQVSGSRGACVPKTPDISRFIASEPVLNMALQLGVGQFIADSLKLCGLNIQNQQEKNAFLAKQGSLTGDSVGNRLATIDLKDASDRITPFLAATLLPEDRKLLRFILAVRSPTILVDGEEIRVASLSTMGNGFTFPLMTLFCLAAVYAVGRTKLGWKRNYVPWDSVGVFGDDIICPVSIYPDVVKTLEGMGLKVNVDKSFAEGYFRESCGGDFYQGYDVTPVYIKDVTTIEGKLIALNQLIKWSAFHELPMWTSLSYLASAIPSKYRNLVPSWEADYAGLRTTEPMGSFTRARKRFEPLACHVHGEFKLACVLGGYILPEVVPEGYVVVNDIDYALRVEFAKEVDLQSLDQTPVNFCESIVRYVTREARYKYALQHVERPIGHRSSIGAGGYTRRVGWVERLTYALSLL